MKLKFIIFTIAFSLMINCIFMENSKHVSQNHLYYSDGNLMNLDDIQDFYGTRNICGNSNGEKCKDGSEYKFFLKMYDLYYLYRTKYNIKLDLPLIMSTLTFKTDNVISVFDANLSDYDRKLLVESDWNVDDSFPLDWNFDFESQKNYLVQNDSSLDMQVLAKNMVRKTVKQECIKNGVVTISRDVKDNEESLQCDEGEELKVSNERYSLDMDKYHDFLLEYLEKKFYLNRYVSNPVRSNGPDYYSNVIPSVKKRKKTSSSSSNNDSSVNDVNLTGNEVIDKLNSIALSQKGNGGSKYWTAYGSGADEWCAMFVSWLFDQVGGIKKYIASKEAGAGDIPRNSVPAGLGIWLEDECTDPSTVPRAGDVILFTPTIYPSDKYTSRHVGYVYKVDDNKVYTVEGNSGTWDCTTSYVTVNEYDRKSCTINGYYRPNY